MCGKADIRRFPLLAWASRAFAHATGGFKGRDTTWLSQRAAASSGRRGVGTDDSWCSASGSSGRAPLRAAVTVFAVVIAGLTTPMLQAQADETTPPAVAPISYLVTFAAGMSAADQAAVLADAGATDVDAIPQLRMHAVSLPGDTAASVADSLRALPSVTNVNLDRERVAEGDARRPVVRRPVGAAEDRLGRRLATPSRPPAPLSSPCSTPASTARTPTSPASWSPAPRCSPAATRSSTRTATAPPWPASSPPTPTTARASRASATRGVKVMPVTVLGADGTGQDSDVIAGVVWAADHGADVILMSFSNPGYSRGSAGRARLRLVEAAPCSSPRPATTARPTPTFPAGDAGVVGVSATDESDELASSSNYGADTFLAAPGVGIVTDAAGGGITLGHRYVGLRRRSSPVLPALLTALTRPPRPASSSAGSRGTPTRPAPPSRPATAASTSAAPWPTPRPTRSSPPAPPPSATAAPCRSLR